MADVRFSKPKVITTRPRIYISSKFGMQIDFDLFKRVPSLNPQPEVDLRRHDVIIIGRLNKNHLIMLRRVKYYRYLLHSCGVFLCDVFLMFFLDNFKSDCLLLTIFLSKSDAIKCLAGL